jgi:hypothetical protein
VSDFYGNLRTNVVVPALKRYGTAITVRTYADSFVPGTGINTRTPTDTAAFGVIDDYLAREIDGTRVQAGDKRLLTAELAVEPKGGDQVIIGGTTWSVVSCQGVMPAGSPAVLYIVQLRR